MASPTLAQTNPPRTYFSVWQRLLRGYGPLAVFAILLVAMSIFVPTKTPDTVNANGVGAGAGSGSGSGSGGGASGAGATGATTPGQAGTEGTPGAPGAGTE